MLDALCMMVAHMLQGRFDLTMCAVYTRLQRQAHQSDNVIKLPVCLFF